MTTLLVASAGGHLQQLHQLRRRLNLDDQHIWVTYDTAQARSLLQDEHVIGAHHPTTKNVPNAVRNMWLARRVIYTQSIDRIVSTGAAVSFPFMAVARAVGVPCHYIESATRVSAPSLTGSMLQLLPGVQLYRQLGDWGRPRWHQGPCVFDGFFVSDRKIGPEIRSAFVSLGTHRFQFPRLLARLHTLLGTSDVEIVWQVGNTIPPARLPGRVEQDIPAHDFDALVRSSDVVIGHAGTGLALTALKHGKVPVLVPRRRRFREHTDDHQVEIAEALQSRGLAASVELDDLQVLHLMRAASYDVGFQPPEPFSLVD